jgi:hypothetical protein
MIICASDVLDESSDMSSDFQAPQLDFWTSNGDGGADAYHVGSLSLSSLHEDKNVAFWREMFHPEGQWISS